MTTEKAVYDAVKGWVIYQGGAPGSPFADTRPTISYTITRPNSQTNVLIFDARLSYGTNSPVARVDWDFGDGSIANGAYVTHEFDNLGDQPITITVTDRNGRRSSQQFTYTLVNNRPPEANLNIFTTDLLASYSALGSFDPEGGALTYDVDWGDDSAHSTYITGQHRYPQPGLYTVTLTVRDVQGLSSSISGVAAATLPYTAPAPLDGDDPTDPGNPPADPDAPSATPKSPWKKGDPTQGLPSSVRIVKWSTIAQAGDDKNPQRAINRLSQDAVVDISGQDLLIPSFQGGEAPNGLYSPHLIGFVGGISNGKFDNRIRLDDNAMTKSQANAVNAQKIWDTSAFSIIRLAPGKQYVMGVNLVGADQPTINDTGKNSEFPLGPARHKGLNVNLADKASLFQNCLLQGFGASNGNGPPWECGSVDSRRSTDFLVRRVEIDGRLPVGSKSRPNSTTTDPFKRGWKRSGGFQWNADKHPIMFDFSLHDTLVSGLTMSIAGTSNNGSNNTSNLEFSNIYLENNSAKGFSGMNLEMVIGQVVIVNPMIHMNGAGGQHVKINGKLTKPAVPDLSPIRIIEPVWSGLAYNGMFAVGIHGWGTVQKTAPIVTKNGKELKPKTSDGDPSKYYRIVPR